MLLLGPVRGVDFGRLLRLFGVASLVLRLGVVRRRVSVLSFLFVAHFVRGYAVMWRSLGLIYRCLAGCSGAHRLAVGLWGSFVLVVGLRRGFSAQVVVWVVFGGGYFWGRLGGVVVRCVSGHVLWKSVLVGLVGHC